ncbi:MAG: hypothetical protein NTV00_02105 [Methylococcales bacterium]|nr:hypothetical protein [Methylococcales bacterium]
MTLSNTVAPETRTCDADTDTELMGCSLESELLKPEYAFEEWLTVAPELVICDDLDAVKTHYNTESKPLESSWHELEEWLIAESDRYELNIKN